MQAVLSEIDNHTVKYHEKRPEMYPEKYLLVGKIPANLSAVFEKIEPLKHLLQENYIDIDCTDKSFVSLLQNVTQYTNLQETSNRKNKNIVILNAHTLHKNHLQYLRKLLILENINYYIFSENMVNHQIANLCKIIHTKQESNNQTSNNLDNNINNTNHINNTINNLLCVKYLKTKSRSEFATHIWSIYSNDTGNEEFNSIGKFLEESFLKASKQKPSAVPQILYLWEHWHRFYTMNSQNLLTSIQSLKAYFHILEIGYF